MDTFRIFFSYICGQQHTWVLGGITLPFCQRCTGLYAGAFLAILLVGIVRPRPGALIYWLHGIFMLAMLPFGFHWVQHGGMVRTFTGALFAFGMVYFFALMPLSSRIGWRAVSPFGYLLLICIAIALLLGAIYWGGAAVAILLTISGTIGLLGLAILTAVNLVLLPGIVRILIHQPAPSVK